MEVEQTTAHLTNEEWIVSRQRREQEQRWLQTILRESRNFPSIVLSEFGYPPEDGVAGTRTSNDQAVLLLRAGRDPQRRQHRHRQRVVARARMTRQARLEFLYHTTCRILGRTSFAILKFPARLLEKRYAPEPTDADTTFAAAVQPTTASTVQWPESGNGWRFGEPNIEDYNDDDITAYWSTGTAVESDTDSWTTDENNEQVSLPPGSVLMDGRSLDQTFDIFGQGRIAPLLSPEETQFEI
jgi:hypothetical protein